MMRPMPPVRTFRATPLTRSMMRYFLATSYRALIDIFVYLRIKKSHWHRSISCWSKISRNTHEHSRYSQLIQLSVMNFTHLLPVFASMMISHKNAISFRAKSQSLLIFSMIYIHATCDSFILAIFDAKSFLILTLFITGFQERRDAKVVLPFNALAADIRDEALSHF